MSIAPIGAKLLTVKTMHKRGAYYISYKVGWQVRKPTSLIMQFKTL